MRRALLLVALMPAGCSRNPSAVFDTAGVHAAETVRLFEYFLAVTTAVWFAVIAVLFVALYRQRVAGETAHFHLRPDASTDRGLGVIIATAITVTVLILTSFVGFSYAIDRRLLVLDSNPAMEIDVTARQWWWELCYSGDKPSDTFTTANEIHVPVGVPVRLKLNSTDVIHSLWLPNIAGKQDIIPGREGDLVIRVDRPGVWRGQCGEFCGLQHAFMAITLFADQPEDFEQWKRHQRSDAAVP